MTAPKKLVMRSDVLLQLARWASVDDYRPIHYVVLRETEAVATDGHRLVRVPGPLVYEDTEVRNGRRWDGAPVFYLARTHIFAAVGAQRAFYREQVGAKLEDDEERSARVSSMLDIWVEQNQVVLADHHVRLQVTWPLDNPTYPPIEQVMCKPQKAPPPTQGFNPKYLHGVSEFIEALGHEEAAWGVALEGWGQRLDPIQFRSHGGAQFVVMPTRFDVEGKG